MTFELDFLNFMQIMYNSEVTKTHHWLEYTKVWRTWTSVSSGPHSQF